jgi:hypothetical protein
MKISHSHLLKIINEELELEALDWSNVGSDARRWMGGMHLAKYPGPWGSGHEPLVTEDDEPERVEDEDECSPDWPDSEFIRHPDIKRNDIREQRDFESKKLHLRSLIKNEMYMMRKKEIKKLSLIESSSDYIQIYNRKDMDSTINAMIEKIKNIEDAIEMMGGSVIDIKTEPEDIEIIDLDTDLASVDKG